MIIDTHAHYDDKRFSEDRDELLTNLEQNGIEYIINSGASVKSNKQTLDLTKKYERVYASLGICPTDVDHVTQKDMEWIETKCKDKKVVAIGETGLDYYWTTENKAFQQEIFASHIGIACENKLPLVIHSRDAAKDTLDILKSELIAETGGSLHCFSYGKEIAREYLKMGFSFGIGGVVTFSNAKKLKEAVAYIPMEHILLETDCPYLAPMPYRGKRNVSHYLPHVAEAIAEIKNISKEEVIRITTLNAKKLFKLP